MSSKPLVLRQLAERDIEQAVAHYVDEGGNLPALRFDDDESNQRD